MAELASSTPVPFAPPRIIAPGGPVSRAIRTLRNVDPEHARVRELRRAIAERIEADLAILDALAGDPDMEPSLGAPEPVNFGPFTVRAPGTPDWRCLGDQTSWAEGSRGDLENDPSDGPEGDDEREPDVDREPDNEDGYEGGY